MASASACTPAPGARREAARHLRGIIPPAGPLPLVPRRSVDENICGLERHPRANCTHQDTQDSQDHLGEKERQVLSPAARLEDSVAPGQLSGPRWAQWSDRTQVGGVPRTDRLLRASLPDVVHPDLSHDNTSSLHNAGIVSLCGGIRCRVKQVQCYRACGIATAGTRVN